MTSASQPADFFNEVDTLVSSETRANPDSSPSRRRARYDLTRAEARLDFVVQSAREKLQRLVDQEEFRAFQEQILPVYLKKKNSTSQSLNKKNGVAQVKFLLRLGRARIPVDELDKLDVGAIAPLLDANKGRVQIWVEGRLFGSGELLVVDGKLAVRIESLETSYSL